MDRPFKVLVWGACDLGKPRVRIMLSSLRAAGAEVTMMRAQVWDKVEDKSGLSGLRLAIYGLRYVFAIVGLWMRYARAPAHDVVLIGYMGHFDALAFWPLRKLKRKPVILDAFISLYDTVVGDRQLLKEGSVPARALQWLEKLSYQSVDLVVFDTKTHASRICAKLGLEPAKFSDVHVGAETSSFPLLPAKPINIGEPLSILFYGQFIPLHGVEVIVGAARLSADRNWRWRMIGDGQEAPRIRGELAAAPIANLEWVNWAAYETLSGEIGQADICLGVFGGGDKAGSVVPNKVWQAIASGRPLITRDSAAMRAIAPEETPSLLLVAADDPVALVNAVEEMEVTLRSGLQTTPHATQRACGSEESIGQMWLKLLSDVAQNVSK